LALIDEFNYMNSGTSEIGHIERGVLGYQEYSDFSTFEFHYKLPDNSKIKREHC